MNRPEHITHARLREVLDYDPETGLMRWRVRPAKRVRPGDKAGCQNSMGRLLVWIDKRVYQVHQLAVLYVTGHWPAERVWHKDRDYTNNRWVNLEVRARSKG